MVINVKVNIAKGNDIGLGNTMLESFSWEVVGVFIVVELSSSEVFGVVIVVESSSSGVQSSFSQPMSKG